MTPDPWAVERAKTEQRDIFEKYEAAVFADPDGCPHTDNDWSCWSCRARVFELVAEHAILSALTDAARREREWLLERLNFVERTCGHNWDAAELAFRALRDAIAARGRG